MQHGSSDLLDLTSNKITKKVELISKLRKEIINYTNNFREFKLIKSDIIERLLDNEEDFCQLNIIIKSITDQNNIQRETMENLEKKLEQTEIQLNNCLSEKKILTIEKEEAIKKIEIIAKAKEEKELYVHDLLSNINFLEDVIKDYQKRIFISKYDRIFSYRSPFKNEEKLKKYYDKFLPNEFKVHNNPYYWLNIKNSYNLSLKNFEDEQKPSSLEKRKHESIVDLIKNRPKSSTIGYIENNNNNIISNKEIKRNENYDSPNNNSSKKEYPKKNNDSTLNFNISNKNLNAKDKEQNIINKKTSSLNNNFLSEVDDAFLKKNISSSNGGYSNKNQNPNKLEFNNNNNNINEEVYKDNQNSNLNLNKISQERERANRVSELLLKIFSSVHFSKTLKRKFGENFEIKLTEKQADFNFIRLVENEVSELIEKDKQREGIIKERYDLNKMRRSIAGRGSTMRAISPSSDSEDLLFPKQNRAFNKYPKNTSGFFDPKLQYGGETCVPSTTRNKSNEKISYASSNNNKKRESKSRLSIDIDNKQYLFGDQQGWNTLKDYFVNN